ncbi:hypothetical protein HPB49_011778 [Dermacentor silvarum]|uniref:Uncharacterized protein n=1 Tax=Dermacentor silvarum TaxID=543639 RepID=A0ACB8DCY3_DERSI|nr:hypothetical protein HPB49_011778 [Dermacentor silvarum]
MQPPQPYSFGYDTADEFGNRQFRSEQGDANNAKTGSYGYTDVNGLYRRVSYVADANGFRATVDTERTGHRAGSQRRRCVQRRARCAARSCWDGNTCCVRHKGSPWLQQRIERIWWIRIRPLRPRCWSRLRWLRTLGLRP